MFAVQRIAACLLCFAMVFINACAFDLAHLKYEPIQIGAIPDASKTIVFQKEVKLTDLPCGYSRRLVKNKKWQLIGSIDTGDVYKPIDHCFTVECSNVFEAYLVLHENRLVGFYLPVEKGFVAVAEPIDLPIY